MNSEAHKNQIIKCFHCGNETPMQQHGQYTWGSKDEENESDFGFFYKYEMFACPVCHKVTIRETYGDETMMNHDPRFNEPTCYDKQTIIFPIYNIDNDLIPTQVKKSYESALKMKNIDKAQCLIALRRTLEFILKDKGAIKGNLQDKIEKIANQGLLPHTLREASSLARELGNSATHDEDFDAEHHDIESMSEFIRYIIEYIYIIPEKITAIQQKMEKSDS